MTEQGDRVPQRRVRRKQTRTIQEEPCFDYDISIAAFGSSHRAGALDQSTQLFPAAHLHMAREWPAQCPILQVALRELGLNNLLFLKYIEIDKNLITALVERWCPSTNTFHLPVGEMTITLQDVQIILGLRIDGDPLIGKRLVGSGRRWSTWRECCIELLGNYPEPTITYHDPQNEEVHATFNMGTTQQNSMMPLRWLRWIFARPSYRDLDEQELIQHTRAYCLFMIGCLLLPDTSGSHVSLQYLPLLEDLTTFSEMSIGGAVLAHLYRELYLSTNPTRVYIGGCLSLLQVWCWERINIGRPKIILPPPQDMVNRIVAYRWSDAGSRQVPAGNIHSYRADLDGLRHSQVIMKPYNDDYIRILHPLCRESLEICTSRVPLISYKRVEWHLADRVMRQFGGVQATTINPIDRNFERVDGRGRADVEWSQYHHAHIDLWLSRRQSITPIILPVGNGREELSTYLTWYKSWASLYLLRPSSRPSATFSPSYTSDQNVMDYIIQSRNIAQRFSGQHGENQSSMQQGFDDILELSTRLEDTFFIDYNISGAQREHDQQHPPREYTYDSSRRSFASSSHDTMHEPPRHSMFAGSSDQARRGIFEIGQSSEHWSEFERQNSSSTIYQPPIFFQESNAQPVSTMEIPYWMAPSGIPSIHNQQDMIFQQPQAEESHMEDQRQHHHRERQAPARYTPGSGAVPRRRRR